MTWLNYLSRHHPDYRNMVIHEENLNALPEDGSKHNNLRVHAVDPNGPRTALEMTTLW